MRADASSSVKDAFCKAVTISADTKQNADLATLPGFVCSERGAPIWCTATAIAVLSKHLERQGVLRRDLFACQDLLLKPIPGSPDAVEFIAREVCDADYTNALVWFNRNGFPHAKKSSGDRCIQQRRKDLLL